MLARIRASLAGILVAACAPSASADTITLTNGRVIVADRAWYEGTQLMYEKSGAVFGLPRNLVSSIEAAAASPAPAPTDPDVARAVQLARNGRDTEAVPLLRAALAREPRNPLALRTLAEASLRLGEPRGAMEAAQRAVGLDERDARAQELLGDALAALGQSKGAATAYRASLRLKADAAVQQKLDELRPAPSGAAGGAEFRLRYDGGVNEPLGVAVLQVLTEAFAEFGRRLTFVPPDPVTVVLETETDFQVGGTPPWAEGVYDGTVRVAVKGVDQPNRHLTALLRHELAHSFVTARTGGNCPTWLQEGIAQWLEGGDPDRSDLALAPRARAGTLFPLLTLEAPFQDLAASDVPLAYAESLGGVAHLLRLRGEPGLVRLLAALGDGLPSEEALPVAIGIGYGEFQRGWEQHLRALR